MPAPVGARRLTSGVRAQMANPNHRRLKQADLMSALGAGALGAGVGAMFANWLAAFALVAVLIGIAIHGWAMFEKRRLEDISGEPRVPWEMVMYWSCWLVLALLVGSIIYRGVSQLR
jgi:hypothetical protein